MLLKLDQNSKRQLSGDIASIETLSLYSSINFLRSNLINPEQQLDIAHAFSKLWKCLGQRQTYADAK